MSLGVLMLKWFIGGKIPFLVTSEAAGKEFVGELACLFLVYAELSGLEIALKVAAVRQKLLLQHPHPNLHAKDHMKCLHHCLAAWKNGDVNSLMCEGRALQLALTQHRYCSQASEKEHKLRVFADLTMQG